METIIINKYGKDEEMNLEQYQKEWDWTISQFRGLGMNIDSFEKYHSNFKALEKIAREMVENAFNDTYEAQQKDKVA
jgi:hypothetical protein